MFLMCFSNENIGEERPILRQAQNNFSVVHLCKHSSNNAKLKMYILCKMRKPCCGFLVCVPLRTRVIIFVDKSKVLLLFISAQVCEGLSVFGCETGPCFHKKARVSIIKYDQVSVSKRCVPGFVCARMCIYGCMFLKCLCIIYEIHTKLSIFSGRGS